MKKKPTHVIDIFLQPGEVYFGERETRIRTLLGSCVAITLWHPRLLIGGMCHYMLPGYRQRPKERELDGRYADEAIQLFLRELHKTGTKPEEYEAKLFGGGNMFPGRKPDRLFNVPDKNVDVGYQLLEMHGFRVKAKHLGGKGHRNVIFDIWSGYAWVRHQKYILETREVDTQ